MYWPSHFARRFSSTAVRSALKTWTGINRSPPFVHAMDCLNYIQCPTIPVQHIVPVIYVQECRFVQEFQFVTHKYRDRDSEFNKGVIHSTSQFNSDVFFNSAMQFKQGTVLQGVAPVR